MVVELPDTRLSLLQRMREGKDEGAWSSFCEIYGPAVYQWGRNQGLQPNDALDVTQETFRTVAEKIGMWRGGFRGWLYAIYRSRLSDFCHKNLNGEVAGGGAGFNNLMQSVPESPADADSDEGRAEIQQLYQRALGVIRESVAPNHWTAFERVAIHGDAPADVAQDLGVSIWTVYKCRTRVLQRLRRELDGLDLLDELHGDDPLPGDSTADTPEPS